MFARRCLTVRNRSRDPRMAVPMGSSTEGVLFGGFKCRIASVRAAGVALRNVQTYFVTRRKSFLWQAQCLTILSEDKFQFSWQAQYFRRNRRQLRGRRSTLDVSCYVFCTNRIIKGSSSFCVAGAIF